MIDRCIRFMKKYKYIIEPFIFLLLLFFYNFTKLTMVNFDHLLFDNYNFYDRIVAFYNFSVKGQSRPNYSAILTGALEYLNLNNYWIWSVGFVLIIGFVCGLIIKEITKNFYCGILTSLLTMCFYTITLEPISMPSAYAFNLGFGVVCVLLSIYYILKYNNSDFYKYKIFSFIAILLAVFNYEVGILYLPILIGINFLYLGDFNVKNNLKKSKEFIFLGIIYTIIFVVVKLKFTSNYGGNTIANDFDLLKVLYTFFFIFITNIPGFFFFYNGSSAYKSPLNYIKEIGVGVENFRLDYFMSSYISLNFIVQIILFTYLIYKIYYVYISSKNQDICIKFTTNKKTFMKIISMLMIIYCIIIPIIPSILTEYTQNQVAARWRLVIIGNQYSYCFMIIASMLFLLYIFPKIFKNKIFSLVICSIIVIQFSMVTFTNEVNSSVIEELGARFKQLDIVLYDITQEIDENSSIIYAPSLFAMAGPLSVPPDYFSRKIKYKTGRDITVINELSNIDVLSSNSIYYLRYMYTDNNENALFILSKQNLENILQYTENNVKLLSNSVSIYCFSNQKEYYITGRINSDKYEELYIKTNNMDNDLMVRDIFKYPVKQDIKSYGKSTKISLKGNNISVNDIIILPKYLSSIGREEIVNFKSSELGSNLRSSQIISGYWEDGWCALQSEYKLKTGINGKMKVSIYNPRKLESLKISVYINDQWVDDICVKGDFYEEEINVPVNQDIYLKLISNSETLSQDGRNLSYILKDVICN